MESHGLNASTIYNRRRVEGEERREGSICMEWKANTVSKSLFCHGEVAGKTGWDMMLVESGTTGISEINS